MMSQMPGTQINFLPKKTFDFWSRQSCKPMKSFLKSIDTKVSVFSVKYNTPILVFDIQESSFPTLRKSESQTRK
jgi:hypothetical protein